MPSRRRSVASSSDSTHGMPSSRETTTAWLFIAPTSTTTAPATRNSGVQAASASGATSTSPGSSAVAACRSRTTRAVPVYCPALPPMPRSTSPAGAAVAFGRVRRFHSRQRQRIVVDDERRLDFEKQMILRKPVGDDCRERRGIGDVVVEFGFEQHHDVFRRGEPPGFDAAATQLADRHAHLVDRGDGDQLGLLPQRDGVGRGLQCDLEGGEPGVVAGEPCAHLLGRGESGARRGARAGRRASRRPACAACCPPAPAPARGRPPTTRRGCPTRSGPAARTWPGTGRTGRRTRRSRRSGSPPALPPVRRRTPR